MLDRSFCAAAASAFLNGGPTRAIHLHLDWRGRLPAEAHARVDAAALGLLLHPDARNPLTEVLRAVGDQVARLYPPDFEALGVDPRADRLRSDHPVVRAIRLVAEGFGVDHFDVYQARRGLMVAETERSPEHLCRTGRRPTVQLARAEVPHRPGGVRDGSALRARRETSRTGAGGPARRLHPAGGPGFRRDGAAGRGEDPDPAEDVLEEDVPRARESGVGGGARAGPGPGTDPAGAVCLGEPGRVAGVRGSGGGIDHGAAGGPGVRELEGTGGAGEHRPGHAREGGSEGAPDVLGVGGDVHAERSGRADLAREGDSEEVGCSGGPHSTRSTAPSGSSLRRRATTSSTRSGSAASTVTRTRWSAPDVTAG